MNSYIQSLLASRKIRSKLYQEPDFTTIPMCTMFNGESLQDIRKRFLRYDSGFVFKDEEINYNCVIFKNTRDVRVFLDKYLINNTPNYKDIDAQMSISSLFLDEGLIGKRNFEFAISDKEKCNVSLTTLDNEFIVTASPLRYNDIIGYEKYSYANKVVLKFTPDIIADKWVNINLSRIIKKLNITDDFKIDYSRHAGFSVRTIKAGINVDFEYIYFPHLFNGDVGWVHNDKNLYDPSWLDEENHFIYSHIYDASQKSWPEFNVSIYANSIIVDPKKIDMGIKGLAHNIRSVLTV